MFRPIALLVVFLVLAACSNGDSTSSKSSCMFVDDSVTTLIQDGLTVTGGGTLRSAWAVLNPASPGSYFVAAEIDGPGMEGNGEIGVWMTRLDLNGTFEGGTSYIASVNAMAEEFSEWGAPPGINAVTPGVGEAKTCVKENS